MLDFGSSTGISFAWNTSGFAYGDYTITAVADSLLGEADTSDNTLIGDTILVTILGDINGDIYANAKDAIILDAHFNEHWE